MTLHQLRVFLAVAEVCSIRAVAERLHISQPAVSAAVASLEREMKVALLRPQGRGIQLTPAGHGLAASLRVAMRTIDSGIRTARSVHDPGSGPVHLAAIATAAEQVLLPLLGEFRRDHPEAQVTVNVGNRATVWRQLGDLEVDLVVAGRPPETAGGTILGTSPNRLVVVGPPSVPGHDVVAHLAVTTWLLREEGSGTREATDELLQRLGIDPPRMILGSNGAVLEAVAAGFGVALLASASVSAAHVARGVAELPCPGTPMERPWHLVASSEVDLNPTARMAAQLLLSHARGFGPTAQGAALLQTS